MKLNCNIIELLNNPSFKDVEKEVNKYKKNNPSCNLLNLGVGDVSKPIIKPVIKAMKKAVNDLKRMDTFKGYDKNNGYDFLKKKILENDYSKFNFSLDELYISDGTKSDATNILELFDDDCKICIFDPMYPIFNNFATIKGRNITLLKGAKQNNFIPPIPNKKYDIIYICSPNNPTGIAYTKEELEKWVNYAYVNKSVILFDNVYYSFIKEKNIPKTIYEIKNADKVAIEFRSFSKLASFTGVRCSYYVIPNKLNKDINKIWKVKLLNSFNGVSYVSQKGAEATYLEKSKKLIDKNICYYLENAKLLSNALNEIGFKIYGGKSSPYIWLEIPNNSSWEFFKFLLNELNIVVIPGIVFGKTGDNYVRISALAKRDVILKGIERIKNYYEKGI